MGVSCKSPQSFTNLLKGAASVQLKYIISLQFLLWFQRTCDNLVSKLYDCICSTGNAVHNVLNPLMP